MLVNFLLWQASFSKHTGCDWDQVQELKITSVKVLHKET